MLKVDLTKRQTSKGSAAECSLLGCCSTYLTAAPEFNLVGFLEGMGGGVVVKPELFMLLNFRFTGKHTIRRCSDVSMNYS